MYPKRTSLLIVAALLLLFSACADKKAEIDKSPSGSETACMNSSDHEGLNNLSISDNVNVISLDADFDAAKELLGPPEQSIRYDDIELAPDCFGYRHLYPKKGVSVKTIFCPEVFEHIISLKVYGASDFKTARGIGIGSGKKEVISAYKELKKDFEPDGVVVIDEACSCALSFQIEADKVTEISLDKILWD